MNRMDFRRGFGRGKPVIIKTEKVLYCRDSETISLGEHLGLNDYSKPDEIRKKKGSGIKNWYQVTNDAETLKKDFYDKVKIKKERNLMVTPCFNERNAPKYNSWPLDNDDSFSNRSENITCSKARVPLRTVKKEQITLTRRDYETIDSVSQYSDNSRVSGGTATSSLSDFLRETLNDPNSTHVSVNGRPISKRMLAEWATRYLRHHIIQSTSNSSTQTETHSIISVGVQIQLNPECSDKSTTTTTVTETVEERFDVTDSAATKAPCSSAPTTGLQNPPSLKTWPPQPSCLVQTRPSQPLMQLQPTQQPLMQNVSPLLSQPVYSGTDASTNAPANQLSQNINVYHVWKNYWDAVASYQQRMTTYRQQQQNEYMTLRKYELAKNWMPKERSQAEALEQVKLDIFNVLMVSKGCAVKYLPRLFFRTVQEKLDWEKLGLPDLRSLLVQLGDKIILKKDKYTGDKYVFANLAGEDFDAVAHIGEFVAEQRDDKFYSVPQPETLTDCDIRELFLDNLGSWNHGQQPQPSYGGASFGNAGSHSQHNLNYCNYNYSNMYYPSTDYKQQYRQ